MKLADLFRILRFNGRTVYDCDRMIDCAEGSNAFDGNRIVEAKPPDRADYRSAVVCVDQVKARVEDTGKAQRWTCRLKELPPKTVHRLLKKPPERCIARHRTPGAKPMQAAHDFLDRRIKAFRIDSDARSGPEVNAARGILFGFRYQRGSNVRPQRSIGVNGTIDLALPERVRRCAALRSQTSKDFSRVLVGDAEPCVASAMGREGK